MWFLLLLSVAVVNKKDRRANALPANRLIIPDYTDICTGTA